MIRKLRMTDFKVFQDQEFDFSPGTTAIVGPNGSGKTTILEAIEFALFRSVTRKEKSVKRLEELIRHSRKKAKIQLEFIAPLNRREYRVIRTIHPGETNADLFLANKHEPEVSGPTRVDQEIVKLLGMTKHAFSALTYVRQGEIFKLSRDTPAKRRSGLYSMMGLEIYDKKKKTVDKELKSMKGEMESIDLTRTRLESIREHLPNREELDSAISAIDKVEREVGKREEFEQFRGVVEKVSNSLSTVNDELSSPRLSRRPVEIKEETEVAEHLKALLDTIPHVAENQLRPYIRTEARSIFTEIFGDRYSDLFIDDDFEVCLFDLQGNKVSLKAASGGEDVCVNFALRVAVNTALQKYSTASNPPGLIILDEPGSGLDQQRRRWLPEAIAGLEVVEQVIVVTHMDELKESTKQVISLTPQGKGRQPLVEVD
ncbi:MAG: ATP-binding cassette domain-containing protein [Candidatus Thorarchaeota archaeon]|nr:ATP-binding cassette domain-containing protein [Candidatus Thorarchaeota archaeon]